MSKFTLAFTLISQVAAHGYVKSIVADGTTYQGYNPEFQWRNPIPSVPGWSNPQNIELGFVKDYSSPDIACHLAGTPGKTSVTVPAGGTVQVEWTPWPESHKGPVIDYLAACTGGDCTTITDKTTLLWNKIAEQGLLPNNSNTNTVPGKFATDTLIQSGNKWTVTIPPSIAPGNYVLRHEIIALHEGGKLGGAQNYPQCINLNVTEGSGGTNTLVGVGTPYDKLYTASDPGILCDIYRKLSSYVIPGPALFKSGSGGSGGNSSSNSQPSSTPSSSSSISRQSPQSQSQSKSNTNTPSTVVAPSAATTFQTSTRATTTIVVPPGSDTGSHTLTGEAGTFYPTNPTGRARKFVCYEEL